MKIDNPLGWVPIVATDLETYMGEPLDKDMATIHLTAVAQAVRAYTRGGGFEGDLPNPDISYVILSAAARSVSNPAQMRAETVGPFQHTPGAFVGFTLPELAVLNRYRKRAL